MVHIGPDVPQSKGVTVNGRVTLRIGGGPFLMASMDYYKQKGLRFSEAFLFEDLLVNYEPFLGVVRAHYMVFWFGLLRREARRLGEN